MPAPSPELLTEAPGGPPVGAALDAVRRLRTWDVPPPVFWPRCLEAFARLAGADAAWLHLPPHQTARFGWPASAPESPLAPGLLREALVQGWSEQRSGPRGALLALRLDQQEPEDPAVILLHKGEAPEDWAADLAPLFGLLADTPAVQQAFHARRPAAGAPPSGDAGPAVLGGALEVLAVLNQHGRFLAVAMALVNELCARFQASRVSLGWVREPHIRLAAMSHTDRFEVNLDHSKALEAAMEECLDADQEVAWPPPAGQEGGGAVCRQHEALARRKGLTAVLSLPLRVEDSVRAVLTLERSEGASFSAQDILFLQLVLSQSARRLTELQRHDRWIGARLFQEAEEWLKKLRGPEYTLAKAAAATVLLGSLFLFLYPWPYKVSGTFVLKTSDTVFVPAPFDGYLGEVRLREGDEVRQGEVILRLDQRELRIQEAEAVADSERFRNEARTALSQNRLAEMRSAASQAEQAEAKLQIARMKLAQAEIRAPYDGIVVESDLHERIGKPVQKGETLFRLAKLEGAYAEVHVEQEDIEAVRADASGRLAFASRPEDRFAFTVERIHPAAEVRDDKNVFVVKVRLADAAPPWWRPGMTGVAKIEAGRRPLAWIWSRRALDHIRLKYLWW